MHSCKSLPAALLLAGTIACAQIPAAPKEPCAKAAAGLTYDVITIHPAKPGASINEESSTMGAGEDRFRAANVQLSQIVQFAYDLTEDQVAGVSGPVASARFDIEAKVIPADPSTPVHLTDHQLQCMVIPLLADRFHLVAHTETRTRPVYELVPVKSDPKLTRAPDSGADGSLNVMFSNNDCKLTAKGETMGDFATALSRARQRPVLDRTGLDGRYTFDLTWTSDDAESTDGNAAPALLTALQEQLGLKLQPAKGPVETLVVDHVEMPSEN